MSPMTLMNKIPPAGRQEVGQRSWFHRMHDTTGAPSVVLQQVATGALNDAVGIDLNGIKHLIGLPGAGKTTLLYLLAGYMAKQDRKACFLFPSIEVASGFLEVLQQYDISTGLLSGQGKKAKRDHAINFAASLGRRNRGFGETRTTAINFSTNCALGGFASHEEFPFPHENPPCLLLKQKDSPKKDSH
jgi:energy-coupling factor transporter ATP-binding protein EcfA2